MCVDKVSELGGRVCVEWLVFSQELPYVPVDEEAVQPPVCVVLVHAQQLLEVVTVRVLWDANRGCSEGKSQELVCFDHLTS
jgi:hypothetical protein